MKKKNDLIYKTFEGQSVHTFIWNGRMCLIGKEVIKILKYSNASKTLNECIIEQYFEEEIEYKKLRGQDLLEFRKMADDICPGAVSIKTRNLTILFEPGLYGVLQYSKKPEGVAFGLWIRREVVSELIKKGYYVLGEERFKRKTKKDVEVIETKENNVSFEEKRRVIQGSYSDDKMKIAIQALELWERANKEGGIFLEGAIQILNEFGVKIK